MAENIVFNYKRHRTIVGIVAFTLGFIVWFMVGGNLPSISDSYYDDKARNIFVGFLFVVGAFLFSYNGYDRKDYWLSKTAALCAIMIALFPTDRTLLCGISSTLEQQPWISKVHFTSAAGMFTILAYFCLGSFAPRVKKKGLNGYRKTRYFIYLACGFAIILSILGYFVLKLIIGECKAIEYELLFHAELYSLIAFGIAWIVAGTYTK